MALFDVVLLTESRYINPSDNSAYVQNILKEDAIISEAFKKEGLTVTRKDWADPSFDWSDAGSVVFRTTWDYFHRFDEFNSWLQRNASRTRFINSSELIQWNIDKHYLEYLVHQNVRTVPTRFIPRSSAIDLYDFVKMAGWEHAVIKPTIGGAARHTYKITPDNLEELSLKLSPLLEEEDFMIQPFQYSIPVEGEWSFMVFGKQYSHAVLKRAKEGDFRVQDDFGGTVHPHQATEEEIEFALKVANACPEEPAYARIDVIRDNDGMLAVSELELIEPELWFRMMPNAAHLLTQEVIRRISA